ncbi:MAG: hypothetical protein ACP5N2_02505 [Candidatus Nanoarchaeia archaeon]
MKTLKKIALITSILATIGVQSIKAQNNDTTSIKLTQNTNYALIDNTVLSKNMFFGMNYGNNPVNQLYLEAGNKNIGFFTWTNLNLEQGKMLEVDIAGFYKGNVSLGEKTKLTLQPTAAYFTFPNSTTKSCGELYLKATLTSPHIDVNLRTAKAIGEETGEGEMVQLVASKTLKPHKNISLTGSLEAIYNNKYFSEGEGISHVGTGLTASYTPFENFSITGKINWQKRTDADFKELVHNEFYGSIGLTYVLSAGK